MFPRCLNFVPIALCHGLPWSFFSRGEALRRREFDEVLTVLIRRHRFVVSLHATVESSSTFHRHFSSDAYCDLGYTRTVQLGDPVRKRPLGRVTNGRLEKRLRRFLWSHYGPIFASRLRKSKLLHFRRHPRQKGTRRRRERERTQSLKSLYRMIPKSHVFSVLWTEKNSLMTFFNGSLEFKGRTLQTRDTKLL